MNMILIVEDEFYLRENLKDLLEAEGFVVLTAKNGVEGYEKAVENLPTIILSDILMPEMNGYEMLKKLQENPSTAAIPFIFLTAKVDAHDFRKGMISGADDYLMKPFSIDELLGAINLRLRKKENYSESLNDFKDQLMQRVPHELRTPLVGIIGFSDILENEAHDLRPDDIKRMSAAINKSGKRLHRRIEKYLLYTELVALSNYPLVDAMNIETKFGLDSDLLVKELKSSFKEYDRENDADLSFENSNLNIYERFYKTILNELIENSVKFSEKGTKISVKGFVDGNYYKTKVVDNGSGLDKKSIKNIGLFNQFSKEKYMQEGLGIGLEVVKKSLKMFDGYMNIKSIENQFTQVEFGIPLANIEVEK